VVAVENLVVPLQLQVLLADQVVEQVVVDQDTIVVEQEIHLLYLLLKVNPVEVPLLIQVLVVAAVEQEQQVLEAEMGQGQNQLQVI
tara:strand:- start:158 stop:415 length:258 start_codon:yes stop_codon:yes gene_type:complete